MEFLENLVCNFVFPIFGPLFGFPGVSRGHVWLNITSLLRILGSRAPGVEFKADW